MSTLFLAPVVAVVVGEEDDEDEDLFLFTVLLLLLRYFLFLGMLPLLLSVGKGPEALEVERVAKLKEERGYSLRVTRS